MSKTILYTTEGGALGLTAVVDSELIGAIGIFTRDPEGRDFVMTGTPTGGPDPAGTDTTFALTRGVGLHVGSDWPRAPERRVPCGTAVITKSIDGTTELLLSAIDFGVRVSPPRPQPDVRLRLFALTD